MALTSTQQLKAILDRATNVLVTFTEHYTIDAIGSALATAMLIKKMGKSVTIAAHNFALDNAHRFLPTTHEIHRSLDITKKVVLSFDISRAPIRNLSYAVEGDRLKIFVTPERGTLRREDLVIDSEGFPYDAIIVLDTPDLAALGALYRDHAEFFAHVPIINIDHHPDNERFGSINLIDVTATATSEVLSHLFHEIAPTDLDADMATCLLAGMVAKTYCFKQGSITPRCLAMASNLVEKGARREEIVHHLFQNKPLATIKLWGRALSNLRASPDRKVLWTTLAKENGGPNGVDHDVLNGMMEELIATVPTAEVVFLLIERNPGVEVIAHCTTPRRDARTIFASFTPVGTAREVRFTILDLPIAEVEEAITAVAAQQTKA